MAKILLFRADHDSEYLAKRVAWAKGDSIMALRSHDDRIMASSILQNFDFVVSVFDIKAGVKSSASIRRLMTIMPVAFWSNADTASTRAAFRDKGIEIPIENIFDQGHETLSAMMSDMKKRLNPQLVCQAPKALRPVNNGQSNHISQPRAQAVLTAG
jgi:hypothetical protein